MKVLIIGLGSIARKHISALQDFKPKNLQLFALRSGRNSQSISRVTDIFDYATAYKISPDFIMISNNTSQHVKTILAVIEWGIPLFIEKPLSHTLNGIDQLFQKLIDHKTKSYIACNLRHLEVIQYLKHDLLQKIERINEVNVYCGSYLPSWRPNVNFRKSYSSNEELGGGVHLDLIHEIDYTYFLFGKPVSKNSLFGKRSNLKIDVVDYANYILSYNHFHVSIILNYYRIKPKRQMEIITHNDILIVDLLQNSIYSSKKEMVIFKSNNTIQDSYKSQMSYFLNLLSSKNASSINDISEAYDILKIALNE